MIVTKKQIPVLADLIGKTQIKFMADKVAAAAGSVDQVASLPGVGLPGQPAEAEAMDELMEGKTAEAESEKELEKLVTRDSLIGVMDALPAVPMK